MSFLQSIKYIMVASVFFTCVFITQASNADIVLSENWADDTLGSAPNSTPDIGTQVTYFGGDMEVFDSGGGNRDLTVVDIGPADSFVVSYLPTPTGMLKDIEVNYRYGITTGGSLSGANAFEQTLDFSDSSTNDVQLMWEMISNYGDESVQAASTRQDSFITSIRIIKSSGLSIWKTI